jgi:hypothetical protein
LKRDESKNDGERDHRRVGGGRGEKKASSPLTTNLSPKDNPQN